MILRPSTNDSAAFAKGAAVNSGCRVGLPTHHFFSAAFLVICLLTSPPTPVSAQSIFDDPSAKQPATQPGAHSTPGIAPVAPIPGAGGSATQPASQSLPPIPDAAALKTAKSLLNDTYGDDIKAATTSDQQKVMAQKLVEAAKGEKGANQYLLFTTARDIAMDAGDLGGCDAALDGVVASFAVDSPKLRLDAYAAISAKLLVPVDQAALCKDISTAIPAALALDEIDVATADADLEMRTAQKANDPALLKQATADAELTRESTAAYAGVRSVAAVLAKQPQDADANLKVGKYRCFIKDDWDGGLPMLALGNDAALKALAAGEIAGVNAADEQVKLGDAWWSVGQKESGLSKQNILSHARTWYEQALSNLHGLAKAIVEKRLTEVAARPPQHDRDRPGQQTSWITPGKWSRRWTIRGADLNPALQTQTYEVFDGGARVKAFSWNLPFVREADGSLSIEGSHFFQAFAKEPNGISVRQWKTRADYTAGKEPMYIGVFEPADQNQTTARPAADASAPLASNGQAASILCFYAHPSDGAEFQAIIGGKLKAISKEDTANVMADPNAYAGITIVAWGANRWRFAPPEVFTQDAQAALQKFVRDGGDLIMLEQYGQTHMEVFDRIFGIKTGGGGVAGQVLLPLLKTRVVEAGLPDDALKTVNFYNSYDKLPDGAVVLVKDTGGRSGIVVSPFGRGRLILIGTNTDEPKKKLVDAVLDFIYHGKFALNTSP